MISQYKKDKPYKERLLEGLSALEKYPNKIPMIIERRPDSQLPKLYENRFLVEADITFDKVIFSVRKKLPTLRSHESLNFFVNDVLVCPNITIGELHSKYADDDKILYISYCELNSFG